MKLTTTNMLSVIADLTSSHVSTATSELSNAQKNFQLVTWIRDSRLTDLIPVIEQSIKALPAGKVVTTTMNRVTGKTTVKTTKYRDIAKRSLVTAWNNAIKDNYMPEQLGTKLVFKLSVAQIEKITAPVNDIETKIARMLGDDIDGKGLAAIMLTITAQKGRVEKDVVKLAQDHAQREQTTMLRDNVATHIQMGYTKEQAVVQVATLKEMDEQDIIEAIG